MCRTTSIKATCRELSVSRKVVPKVLRGSTELSCERKVQPKHGPIKDNLDALLVSSGAEPARERLAVVRIFEEGHGMGFTGGYDALRWYVQH